MKTFITLLLALTCLTMYSANDKYRIIITDDPATTITIGWDQYSGSNPVVYFGTTDYGTNYSRYQYKKQVDRSVRYKGMNNTFAKLTRLSPNTNYFFVIKDNEGVSKRYWFRTAPDDNRKMSFIAGGDSRNNRTPRRNANLLVSKLKPTAVFFGGDMTSGDTGYQWKKWFYDWQYTIASDGRMFPIIPARGNHEGSNKSIYNLFNVPSSSVYYDITFGRNLYTIYTLNSEISAGGNQYSWLKQKLKRDRSIWKSAQYHKPMRPHVAAKSEGNDEYYNWSSLFYNYGVKLVYESDSHTVKTTWPVKPCDGGYYCEQGFQREDDNGTVYVGEGCWGAPLRSSNDAKSWTRNVSTFNQFKWIFVDQSKIELRTIRVDNAENVGELSNNSSFEVPYNLNIWKPSNGGVVKIYRSGSNSSLSVSLTNPSNGATYGVNDVVNISAESKNASSVEFYVNNSLIKTTHQAPYAASWSPDSNNVSYTIKAVASNKEGEKSVSEEKTIYVGSVDKTVTSQISRSSDDAEEYQSSGKIYMNSSDLELVYDGVRKGNQHIGLLFRDLDIPNFASITNAYIQFTTDEKNSGNTSLKIKVENTSNPKDITGSSYSITDREFYEKSITWNPSPWNSIESSGKSQKTPSLKDLVQYIVQKRSWKLGNGMLFYISGTGKRTAKSYDGNSAQAPKLVVTYKTDDTSDLTLSKKIEKKSSLIGVKSVNLPSEIALYPNPFLNVVSLKGQKNTFNWVAKVVNSSGIQVLETRVIDNKINLSTILNKGVYIIELYDSLGHKKMSEKIIRN